MSQPASLPPRQRSTALGGIHRGSVAATPPPRRASPSALPWDWDDRWRKQASCRETDPDLFFPVGSTSMALAHIEAAKAVCAACRVRGACLEFALRTNQDAGIWGGTSEEERRQLRKRWVAARKGGRTVTQ